MDDAYREVIVWKLNLYSLPKCNTSNDFVKTLAGLYSIAASNLVLQATGKSKTRVIRENICRRMTLEKWQIVRSDERISYTSKKSLVWKFCP
ncbi:hypothetical protein GJ496_006857 [Pomphorhynchus laevis]|nr:hypothetical protein GJ496_006857 [Pomphorhynchus laevis]